jgi:hypothetical protein
MPAHDRVRLHDDQGGAPISPRVGEQDPEQAISVAEWGTLGGTPEHRQLLTEREVLKRDSSVSTAEQRKESEQDDKRGQHELSFRAIDQESNGVVGDLVLAKDRVHERHAALWRQLDVPTFCYWRIDSSLCCTPSAPVSAEGSSLP